MMNWQDVLSVTFWNHVPIAILCGFIIGLERQLRGKPIGMRTSILICLGTTTFVALSVLLAGEGTDPTRVLGQVVTGIGFLGAGVMMAKEGIVVGVTSAAVIWVLAGVGCCIGFNHSAMAIALSIITVLVLVGVDLLEHGVDILRKGVYSAFDHRSTSDD